MPPAEPLDLLILDPRPQIRRGPLAAHGNEADSAKLLATYRNARVVADFPLRHGAAGYRLRRILARQEAIRAYLDGDPGQLRLPTETQLLALGRDLFECLFPGDVRRLYDGARDATAGRRLDIVLTSSIHWLADLPWEFAFDPTRKLFLATEEVNFVRSVVTAVPTEVMPARRGGLRILVVVAQPLGWAELSAAEETSLVRRAFLSLIEAGLVELEVLSHATPQTLHERLEWAHGSGRPFDVVHFIGHGEYREDDDVGCLVFEDGRSASVSVETAHLRKVICRRGVRLLFLNACETGSAGGSDFNRGVAQGLVAAGVPAVVGNRYKVLDTSATTFAQHFYRELASGASLGNAAREARIAVSYSYGSDAIDWAVPVVFAQNAQAALCRATTAHTATVQPGRRAQPACRKVRRARGAQRIGLWDVNGALPDLDKVAEHLSRVQSTFAFETVQLSAPIGSWRLVRFARGRTRGYVLADQVAARLRRQPEQLGLQKIFCLTTLPLGDREFENLYRWDEDPHDAIAVFSLAGFRREFDEPGWSAQRAIANLLAGSLVGLDWHWRGVAECPCYFNGERNPWLVGGSVNLCPECRKRLAKRLRSGRIRASFLGAIESLLGAYPAEVEPPGNTGARIKR